MAAATTDKFMDVSRKWVGQIGSAGVADAVVTTVPLLSSTNLPSTTLITLVIGRVDSAGTKTPTKEETITGIVSGNNIVSVVRGVEGTAQAHTAGAVVELLFTASQHNALMDGLLVEHSQKGNHTDVCATSLQVNTEAFFDAEVDNGNSGASDTIDWTVGNRQKSTLTSNVGYTFTAPSGPANLVLKVVQGSDGSRTAAFPAAVQWPSGTAPTLSTASDSVDILVWYYDGTNYFGNSSTNFS